MPTVRAGPSGTGTARYSGCCSRFALNLLIALPMPSKSQEDDRRVRGLAEPAGIMGEVIAYSLRGYRDDRFSARGVRRHGLDRRGDEDRAGGHRATA